MIQIRPMLSGDIEAVTNIYAHYVEHTVVTFDTERPTPQTMAQTLAPILKGFPSYVCTDNEKVIGYAYVHPWKTRTAYNLTLETTVYLHPSHTRKGLGSQLMHSLIESCRQKGFHALVACITIPNEASTALHERLGFKQVSHFHEVGRKFGQWLDVADYELLLGQ